MWAYMVVSRLRQSGNRGFRAGRKDILKQKALNGVCWCNVDITSIYFNIICNTVDLVNFAVHILANLQFWDFSRSIEVWIFF